MGHTLGEIQQAVDLFEYVSPGHWSYQVSPRGDGIAHHINCLCCDSRLGREFFQYNYHTRCS